jgi:hypothetical protein
MLPFLGLAQERAALNETEANGLRYKEVIASAHVFQDGLPARIHEFDLPCFPLARPQVLAGRGG